MSFRSNEGVLRLLGSGVGCCGERVSGFYIGVSSRWAHDRAQPAWLTEKGIIFIALIECACQ